MIQTGLPYKIEEMEDIKNNGAIVDLSKLDFIGIPENKRLKTALIYLRNTGFNVDLDFSHLSKEEKYELLLLYLTQDIDCNNRILAESWSKIFNYATGLNTMAQCIISDEDIPEFIETNYDTIGNALRLLLSLPIYLIKKYKLSENEDTIDISSFEEIKDKPIGINLSHIIGVEGISLIYSHEYDIQPANYTEIFTSDNYILLDALMKSTFGFTFLCLMTEDSEKLKKLFNEIDIFNRMI